MQFGRTGRLEYRSKMSYMRQSTQLEALLVGCGLRKAIIMNQIPDG